MALRRMADQSVKFSHLCNPQPQTVALSQPDEDIMWSVVDYSTMSNRAPGELVAEEPADAMAWQDSWIGLFGGLDDQYDMNFEL